MKKTTTIIASLLCIIVLFSACTSAPTGKVTTEDTLEIGSILILSGGGSAWGEAAKHGIDMAVEDLNKEGGILGKKVVIIYEDDQADPKNTLSAFTKLTELDDIDFIIGPTWSKQGVSLKPLIDDEVVISPSLGSKEFNEGTPFAFNSRQHDYILSENLAEYVFEEGHRTIAILSVNDPYNKEQADQFKTTFESLGGRVEYLFEPMLEQKDVRTDVIKIVDNKDIDAVIAATGGTALTSLYAIQMKELGVEQPVYSLSIDQTRITESRGGCDGWIYLSAFTPSEEFTDRYVSTYGSEVHIGSDSSYDAVMMLAQAMESTGSTDPADVQVYLSNMKSFSGVSGELFADGEGGFTKDYKLMTVVDGKPAEMN